MESRSFGPSNKSKIKQKTPSTNLQYLFEGACMKEFYRGSRYDFPGVDHEGRQTCRLRILPLI